MGQIASVGYEWEGGDAIMGNRRRLSISGSLKIVMVGRKGSGAEVRDGRRGKRRRTNDFS